MTTRNIRSPWITGSGRGPSSPGIEQGAFTGLDKVGDNVSHTVPVSRGCRTSCQHKPGFFSYACPSSGASFYFVEIGLAYLDPFWVVSLRLCSGAAALYLWFRSRGLRLPASGRFWLMAMMMGALNNVIPFTLIAWGQQFVTGGLASIVNANTAFISVIVSKASEPARWNRIAGVLIGVLGVAIAIGLGNPDTGGTRRRSCLAGWPSFLQRCHMPSRPSGAAVLRPATGRSRAPWACSSVRASRHL